MKKYIQCVQNNNKNVTPQETIYAIKKAGFDGVFLQWFNKDWEFSQEEQLKLCRKLELDVEFVHLWYKGINNIWIEGEEGDVLVDAYLRDFDVCKSYNISMAVMHVTAGTKAPDVSLIGIKRFQKIVDYAETLGINIAFENTKISGYLEYIFSHIKNPNVGICFDSGHCHCHFDDKFSWDAFKDKIIAVHLHDNDKSDDMHLLPFDGTIDWKEFCNKLKEANYNGPITLESCYKNEYLNITVDEFYKLSLERARQLKI